MNDVKIRNFDDHWK